MIKLEIEPYCSDCLYFDADVQRPERMLVYGEFMNMDGSITDHCINQTDTVIRCQHRKLCANIKRYLHKQEEKEAKGENNEN